MKKFSLPNLIFGGFNVMLWGWLVASWIDVLAHQSVGGTEAAWNAIVILLKIGGAM